MSLTTFPFGYQPLQILDNNGKPLANGTIDTYYAGTTNVAVTYADALGAANNPNPIQLDASGIASAWGDANISYHLVTKSANGVQLRSVDNYNFGTGLLSGAVLVSGDQVVHSIKSFDGVLAIGPASNAEYTNALYNFVVGAQTQNVAGVEFVSNRSANISATTAEGVVNGQLNYDLLHDKWTLVIAGTVVASFSNSAVDFPQAATFTANGQSFLTGNSIVQISGGGTGQNTRSNAILALVPPVAGNTGNALVTDGTTVKWGSTLSGVTLLASPYVFFNGTTQTSWTTFNTAAAGVQTGATKALVQGYGTTFGSGPGGYTQIYSCGRASSSFGNVANHPEADTFILCTGDVQNASHVQGSGGGMQAWVPIRANLTFDYIAAALPGGFTWQNLVLSVVGYA